MDDAEDILKSFAGRSLVPVSAHPRNQQETSKFDTPSVDSVVEKKLPHIGIYSAHL